LIDNFSISILWNHFNTNGKISKFFFISSIELFVIVFSDLYSMFSIFKMSFLSNFI
jgi:hypothetical protein